MFGTDGAEEVEIADNADSTLRAVRPVEQAIDERRGAPADIHQPLVEGHSRLREVAPLS